MQQIECPRCGSFKVMSDRVGIMGVGLVMFVLGGLFSFLIFPLIFCFIGIVLLIVAALKKTKMYTCNSCRYSWKK